MLNVPTVHFYILTADLWQTQATKASRMLRAQSNPRRAALIFNFTIKFQAAIM